MVFSRSSRKALTDAERQLVALLLHGNDPDFRILERQWGKPFALEYERPILRGDYHLRTVFDGSLEDEYRLDRLSGVIDDLEIRVKGVEAPIRVHGHVYDGILANIVLTADAQSRWPRRLEIQGWRYLREESQRRARDFLAGESPHEGSIPPSTIEEIDRARKRALVGVEILSPKEFYTLDVEGADRHLVFARRVDGSVYTLELDSLESGGSAVFLWELGEDGRKQAGTVTEWLQTIMDGDE